LKKHLLLQKFDYTIPSSAMVCAEVKQYHIVADHLPLMKVCIDFETGALKLEGDWQFMLATNKYNGTKGF